MFRILLLTLFIWVATPATSWATTAFEGINLSSSNFVTSSQQDNGETGESTKITDAYISTRIGYTLEGGFYLGWVDESQVTGDGTADLESTNKGITVGFTDLGCYSAFHYFTESTKELASNTLLTGKGGWGLDIGRQFELGSVLSFGAQISYRSITYKEKTLEGLVSSTNFQSKTWQPMVTFGLTF